MISFPIIQSGKIVLQLNVSEADETWGGTGTTQFVDELNENIGINDTPIIVYYEKNGYLVKGNELICFNSAVKKEDQLQYETIESALLEILESSTDALNLESGLTELGYVENPVSNETASTRSVAGFAMNTSTCKLLEIANCTVDQDCYVAGDAGKYGLCWASTAITMIRYRSGDHYTLRPAEVAECLGIDCKRGATVDEIYNALVHYLGLNSPELDQYQAVDHPASSFLEIQHNINNCFPIAMGCTGRVFIFPAAHIVTIIGYNGQQLIYWNSATLKIETTTYNSKGTYINSGGIKFKWAESILISL